MAAKAHTQREKPEHEVVIIGAGISGIGAAIALRRAGIDDVVIFEQADDIASREFGKTNPDIRRFESTPVIISELANGGVDAAIGDNGVIAFRTQEHKQLKTVSDASFPKEYFGIVVKQGNKALLDKLNKGLATAKTDGTYAQIYKKWFQTEAPALPAQ